MTISWYLVLDRNQSFFLGDWLPRIEKKDWLAGRQAGGWAGLSRQLIEGLWVGSFKNH